MSSEFSVDDSVKESIGEIIKKNNWDPVTDIKYFPGSEAGDGYASKHVAVDVIKGDKIFRLFVKCALKNAHLDKIYEHEAYFYNIIYPAYVKFLKKRKVSNGFKNISKSYATSTKNVIVLENVKEKGFALFDRKKIMNHNHIMLVFKTFAKFHAISFAFKDQERKQYDKLISEKNEDFIASGIDGGTAKMLKGTIVNALSKLDAVTDRHIIEKLDVDALTKSVVERMASSDEYSILTQGDCWCNNMMFSYEKGNIECPTDIILVDWQIFRTAPPVLDLSYFFYTIASEDALNKLDFYLKCYYAELYDQIKTLGSDPEKLYPYPIFVRQWNQYCKYGLAMAFLLFKIMLLNKDEVPNFEEINMEEVQKSDPASAFNKLANEDEYIRRIRILAEFMIKNNYI